MDKDSKPTLVKQFAHAMAHFDVEALDKLLESKGEYIIQDSSGEDLLVEDKAKYLEWLNNRFQDHLAEPGGRKKLRFDFDKCTGCSVGCQVVYFEGGLYPRLAEDPEEILMHGLMIDFNSRKTKINKILFCYSFRYLDKHI